MDTQHLGTIMGTIRTGVGVSLLAAPAWAGRIWVGEDADGHGTKVFARAIGARDVALGAGILAASTGGESRQVARLVQLGAVADVADLAATLVAWKNLEGHRRWLMPIIAVAVSAAGAMVARQIDVASRAESADSKDPVDGTESADQQPVALDATNLDGNSFDGSGLSDIATPLHSR